MDAGVGADDAPHQTIKVGPVPVATASYASTIQSILRWASRDLSRYVCACSAHGVVVAQDDSSVAAALTNADLVVPDGMPLVWVMRWRGAPQQTRVRGTSLFGDLCSAAAAAGIPVFLYGSTEETLTKLSARLPKEHPGLQLVGTLSPPFRTLTDQEDVEVVERIVASGARIVLVGLGTPNQDRWMAAHRGRIPAVMVGLGAAFDYHAGNLPPTPMWMRRTGLEWLFRLACEPRRLWRRYASVIPRFLFLMLVTVLTLHRDEAHQPRVSDDR